MTDLITPVTASAAVTTTAIQKPAALAEPRLLLPEDLKAIARKNGIDVDTPLSETEMAGPDYADIGKWFDGLTAHLPTKAAARLKNEFLRNARTGLELRRKGIKAGTFTSAVDGGDTVFYYHTEAGPQEVYRLDGTVPTQQEWATTIVFDVISLITAMFGIVTTVPNIRRAMARLQPKITALITAIQQAINASDSDLLKAKKVAMAVVGVIYASNLTYTVVKEIVMGDLWSFAFTVANTVLMLVALVLTDGAAIFIRIAQMGIAIGQLVHDVLKPHSQTAAAN
jgi:hypothetical protein